MKGDLGMVFREDFILFFRIIVIIVLLIFLGCLYVIIKKKITSNKNKVRFIQDLNSTNKVKYNILSILFIIIVGISWVMNLGWIRVIFIIPMIFHAILFYFSNSSYHRNNDKISKPMNLVNSAVYGTYLLFYILLPDGGDTEDSIRVFLGFIKNEMFVDIAAVISQLLLVANLILIIIQIIYTVKVKRELRNKNI